MFSLIVELYRAVGRPVISGDEFVFLGRATESLVSLVSRVESLDPAYGSFRYISSEGENLEFTFGLPSNDKGRFFSNIDEMIQGVGSLGRGCLPGSVYVVDLDWASYEPPSTDKLKVLGDICALVLSLKELALGVSESGVESDRLRLFFATPYDQGQSSKTFFVETKVVAAMLDGRLRHVSLLENIVKEDRRSKSHAVERKMIFRMALADLVDRFGDCDVFGLVVSKWDELLRLYRANLYAYVNRFAFDKVRREVAQAELEYASKLSAVLGDVAGKVLALPVSLVGLVVLNKSSSYFDMVVYAVGLMVVTLVMRTVLYNQKLQVLRLEHSFASVFSGFKEKKETYPSKIREVISKTDEQISVQVSSLKKTFWLLNLVALMPLVGVLAVLLTQYYGYLLYLLNLE